MAVIPLGPSLPSGSSHLPADLDEQPVLPKARPPTWCCSGWRLPRFTRRRVTAGDSSLWPCSSLLSTARAATYLRPGVTRHPALWSPDFPLPRYFVAEQRRSGWLPKLG